MRKHYTPPASAKRSSMMSSREGDENVPPSPLVVTANKATKGDENKEHGSVGSTSTEKSNDAAQAPHKRMKRVRRRLPPRSTRSTVSPSIHSSLNRLQATNRPLKDAINRIHVSWGDVKEKAAIFMKGKERLAKYTFQPDQTISVRVPKGNV